VYWSTIIRVFIEEGNTIVTIIVTHQGVEKLIDGDEPQNLKMLVYFKWSKWIAISLLDNQCIRRKSNLM